MRLPPIFQNFSLFALATLFVAFALPARLEAHSFQTNLYPDVELKRDELVIELWIATFLFPPLAHIEFGDGKPRPDIQSADRTGEPPAKTSAEDEELRRVLEEFFAKSCPIEFDGKPVPPKLDWLQFEEIAGGEHLGEPLDFTFAKARFRYPFDTPPKKVKVRWGIWFPEGAVEVQQVEEGEVISHDPNVLDQLIFTPDGEYAMYLTIQEPEFIWHAPAKEFGDAIAVIEPAPVRKRSVAVPLAPIGLILGLGVFLLSARRLHIPPVAVAGAGAGVLALAFVVRAALPVDVPRFWDKSGGAAELTTAEAEDEFLRLHRGIYRAFEAETEDSIYNTLAQSVDGVLLDRLYEEIFQSLIMREEGGAVARVRSIDHLETEVSPDQEGRGYQVSCAWRVHGIVTHFGHSHRRSNEYQADYLIAPREDRWKIASVEVNLQKRIKSPPLDESKPQPQEDDSPIEPQS